VKAQICVQSLIHSFNPSTQDLSGTKDASFFLECRKEMVTHQFIAVLCDMSCAREIYLHLSKTDGEKLSHFFEPWK